MSSVNVLLLIDDIVEGEEIFSVALNLPSSVNRGITVSRGNGAATVTITDSNGKYCNM